MGDLILGPIGERLRHVKTPYHKCAGSLGDAMGRHRGDAHEWPKSLLASGWQEIDPRNADIDDIIAYPFTYGRNNSEHIGVMARTRLGAKRLWSNLAGNLQATAFQLRGARAFRRPGGTPAKRFTAPWRVRAALARRGPASMTAVNGPGMRRFLAEEAVPRAASWALQPASPLTGLSPLMEENLPPLWQRVARLSAPYAEPVAKGSLRARHWVGAAILEGLRILNLPGALEAQAAEHFSFGAYRPGLEGTPREIARRTLAGREPAAQRSWIDAMPSMAAHLAGVERLPWWQNWTLGAVGFAADVYFNPLTYFGIGEFGAMGRGLKLLGGVPEALRLLPKAGLYPSLERALVRAVGRTTVAGTEHEGPVIARLTERLPEIGEKFDWLALAKGSAIPAIEKDVRLGLSLNTDLGAKEIQDVASEVTRNWREIVRAPLSIGQYPIPAAAGARDLLRQAVRLQPLGMKTELESQFSSKWLAWSKRHQRFVEEADALRPTEAEEGLYDALLAAGAQNAPSEHYINMALKTSWAAHQESRAAGPSFADAVAHYTVPSYGVPSAMRGRIRTALSGAHVYKGKLQHQLHLLTRGLDPAQSIALMMYRFSLPHTVRELSDIIPAGARLEVAAPERLAAVLHAVGEHGAFERLGLRADSFLAADGVNVAWRKLPRSLDRTRRVLQAAEYTPKWVEATLQHDKPMYDTLAKEIGEQTMGDLGLRYSPARYFQGSDTSLAEAVTDFELTLSRTKQPFTYKQSMEPGEAVLAEAQHLAATGDLGRAAREGAMIPDEVTRLNIRGNESATLHKLWGLYQAVKDTGFNIESPGSDAALRAGWRPIPTLSPRTAKAVQESLRQQGKLEGITAKVQIAIEKIRLGGERLDIAKANGDAAALQRAERMIVKGRKQLFAAEGQLGMYQPGLSHLLVPPEVLQQLAGTVQDIYAWKIGAAFNEGLSYLRGGLLLSPRFHLTNLVDNWIVAPWLANVARVTGKLTNIGPFRGGMTVLRATYDQALRDFQFIAPEAREVRLAAFASRTLRAIVKGTATVEEFAADVLHGAAKRPLGQRVSARMTVEDAKVAKYAKEIADLGIAGHGWLSTFSGISNASQFGRVGEVLKGSVGSVLRVNRGLGAALEDIPRMATYVAARENGYSMEAALRVVNVSFVDYSNEVKAPIDRLLGNITLYYPYWRGRTEQVLASIYHQPYRIVEMNALRQRAMGSAYGPGGEIVPPQPAKGEFFGPHMRLLDKGKPIWMHGGVLPIPWDFPLLSGLTDHLRPSPAMLARDGPSVLYLNLRLSPFEMLDTVKNLLSKRGFEQALEMVLPVARAWRDVATRGVVQGLTEAFGGPGVMIGRMWRSPRGTGEKLPSGQRQVTQYDRDVAERKNLASRISYLTGLGFYTVPAREMYGRLSDADKAEYNKLAPPDQRLQSRAEAQKVQRRFPSPFKRRKAAKSLFPPPSWKR